MPADVRAAGAAARCRAGGSQSCAHRGDLDVQYCDEDRDLIAVSEAGSPVRRKRLT